MNLDELKARLADATGVEVTVAPTDRGAVVRLSVPGSMETAAREAHSLAQRVIDAVKDVAFTEHSPGACVVGRGDVVVAEIELVLPNGTVATTVKVTDQAAALRVGVPKPDTTARVRLPPRS